jgi:hypothetical protein
MMFATDLLTKTRSKQPNTNFSAVHSTIAGDHATDSTTRHLDRVNFRSEIRRFWGVMATTASGGSGGY